MIDECFNGLPQGLSLRHQTEKAGRVLYGGYCRAEKNEGFNKKGKRRQLEQALRMNIENKCLRQLT
ncbi:hypothetical protein ACTQW9_19400 [Lachnospiraceae bacterium LCP19S3_B12]